MELIRIIGEKVMKYCTNCGSPLKAQQQFCTNCGHQVNARSAMYVQEGKSSKWPWIIGIIGILILLAGMGFAGLQLYKSVVLNPSTTQSQANNQTTSNTQNSENMQDNGNVQSSQTVQQQPINNGPQISQQPSVSQRTPVRVTRSNVIDLVEDYEGHYLDTSTYTFKEPEQRADGSWGFSILYKSSGRLAGSYIVDPDGTVTKYDEKGRPE
ncbi:zinc ribbon domain-containing protein [Staphylococcus microti]|nr:zinc ribbon domain-containing protein [Staphylococcus microti]